MNILELFKTVKTFVFDVDGVLASDILLVLSGGELARNMNSKDGYALQLAVKQGYRVVIISGGKSTSVKDRLVRLGVNDVYLDITNKKEKLQEYVFQHELRWDEILYMGDDIPDAICMQMVGLSCCPADAAIEIRQISQYISPLKGGKGCARDVIEKVLKLQGLWIDQVNKPGKMVVEKIIDRRWAIFLHLFITTIGVIVSLYVSIKSSWIIILANIASTLLLWFYSTTFKKKLLSGNIIIAALTAWTILVLYFAVNTTITTPLKFSNEIKFSMQHIYKYAVLYGGFAFIISLIREVIKDMEDMHGDAKYQCNTLPIAMGIPAAKIFVSVWIIVLTGCLAIIQFYALQLGWWLSTAYCCLFIILPLIWVLQKLYIAQTSTDYHKLSTAIKLIMLTGILSMLFFKLYHK
ncbi:MAG: UbiA family prenyltransferase [Sphingobacteriales bacterium]|nr:UbiA family prenyltransferase [Sphingobacteriales bacterium]